MVYTVERCVPSCQKTSHSSGIHLKALCPAATGLIAQLSAVAEMNSVLGTGLTLKYLELSFSKIMLNFTPRAHIQRSLHSLIEWTLVDCRHRDSSTFHNLTTNCNSIWLLYNAQMLPLASTDCRLSYTAIHCAVFELILTITFCLVQLQLKYLDSFS